MKNFPIDYTKNVFAPVVNFVCKKFDIEICDLYSKKKFSTITNARFFAWFILKKELGVPSPYIASKFGRTVGVVNYGVRSVEKWDMKNSALQEFKKEYPHIHTSSSSSSTHKI